VGMANISNVIPLALPRPSIARWRGAFVLERQGRVQQPAFSILSVARAGT
jgi:hypothetical protein